MLAAVAALCLPAPCASDSLFDEWAKYHHRDFSDAADKAARRANFASNLDEMAYMQERSPRAVYSILADEAADLSAVERRERHPPVLSLIHI